MDNALATGTVWHRRREPRSHVFRYKLYFSLLDLDQLEATFRRSRWWSVDRFNLVALRRRDYIAPFDCSLVDAVRQRVDADLGFRPNGRVRMLTHLRQWGFCFNPVTFYFCEHDDQLAVIIAEVHNTPWNERRAYVLDARDQAGPNYRFEFDKDFHVSPFLPMELAYDWRFRITDEEVAVHMLLHREGGECFRAGMSLALEPVSGRAMALMPFRFPLVTLKVVTAIYWQALKLWIKGIPFHPHPDSRESTSRAPARKPN